MREIRIAVCGPPEFTQPIVSNIAAFHKAKVGSEEKNHENNNNNKLEGVRIHVTNRRGEESMLHLFEFTSCEDFDDFEAQINAFVICFDFRSEDESCVGEWYENIVRFVGSEDIALVAAACHQGGEEDNNASKIRVSEDIHRLIREVKSGYIELASIFNKEDISSSSHQHNEIEKLENIVWSEIQKLEGILLAATSRRRSVAASADIPDDAVCALM